ncbi:isochorismatase family protein [Pseudomonas sp. S36]|nr:isochorismatase family protein [Pseudomonas sp. S36]
MKIASFDVDAQNGFTANAPHELPVPDGDEIAPDLNAMALRADVRLGSKDAHPANASWVVADPAHMPQPLSLANADLTWVSHCVPGTPGFELLPGLPAPIDYDYFGTFVECMILSTTPECPIVPDIEAITARRNHVDDHQQ